MPASVSSRRPSRASVPEGDCAVRPGPLGLQVDDGLERDSLEALGHGIRLFGLAQRPREAIEQIPAVALCLEDPSRHHLEKKLVVMIAAVDIVGGDQPDLGAI